MASFRYIKGDVTEAEEKVILQGCNAQGKMNSGVAKAIRDRWPNVFYDYSAEHEVNGLALGAIYPVLVRDRINCIRKIVINGITQEFYGREPGRVYVDYWAISQVLFRTASFLHDFGISDVAMPKIGAGLGGGDWDRISRIIQTDVVGRGINVWVYVP